MTWPIVIGAILLPIYVHMLAKIAARAWYSEKRRHQRAFLQEFEGVD
jgi:hypothetical protein